MGIRAVHRSGRNRWQEAVKRRRHALKAIVLWAKEVSGGNIDAQLGAFCVEQDVPLSLAKKLLGTAKVESLLMKSLDVTALYILKEALSALAGKVEDQGSDMSVDKLVKTIDQAAKIRHKTYSRSKEVQTSIGTMQVLNIQLPPGLHEADEEERMKYVESAKRLLQGRGE